MGNAAAYGYYLPALTGTPPAGAVAASLFLNDTGGLLYDGSTLTGYTNTSTAAGQNLDAFGLIDLGAVKTVTKLTVSSSISFGLSTTTALYYSTDGTAWTLLGTFGAIAGTTINISARYLQARTAATSTLSGGGQFNRLNEFYGFDASGVVYGAPPATPPPTATLTATPTTILAYRDSSVLTWTTANATSASIDQGIGAVALAGSLSASPVVTTTYTLTATGAGGSATAQATVTVVQPREIHVCSSGTLFATIGGNQVEFALLQNVTAKFGTARKLLFDCPTRSLFPVDAGFCEGAAVMEAETASISPEAVLAMLGGSLNTGAIPNILTLQRTLSKTPFILQLTIRDTTGAQLVYTFNNVYCPELTLPARAKDFVRPKFPIVGLPDANGIVATATAPW